MRIAVATDEVTPLATEVVGALREGGHDLELVGPLADEEHEWVRASAEAARRVTAGRCERAVVLCWTGTGAAIAANKMPGVRAALCADAATARMAREYNHANVLALSLRLTGLPVAREIVAAFLDEPAGEDDFTRRNLAELAELEAVGSLVDLDWPAPVARPELWLEDLPEGTVFRTPSVVVTEQAVISYARRFDPQPFHLDPQAACETVFGGLVASGWHTTAIMMRLFTDHGPRIHGGLVGLGVDELRWGALRPPVGVHMEGEVMSAQPSRSGKPRGILKMRVRMVTAHDEEVQSGLVTMLVPART
ncbi:MAG TPA: RpiB/LacA/LacB family sugar-phosphate isomerase [Miltoncostaeaceae bacterium]|nr:RpiB/LacA/LacB family sugar-phosphate isomerase [Miltoncostaeaceae bacterium]